MDPSRFSSPARNAPDGKPYVRDVGPSQKGDVPFVTSRKVYGFVYDYVTNTTRTEEAKQTAAGQIGLDKQIPVIVTGADDDTEAKVYTFGE